ncbi:MAG: hypothetical protein GY847_28730, partial [Proteobacteria bacterium]|nr:hypothetical protein [Pseudomonadota bacterium]
MATPQSRIPPSSVETEKALLGAIILENRIMGGCSRSLSADSFFDSRNKRVFEGCLSLWPDGEIDTVSLYDETGVAIMYLNTLADSTFVSHWEQYVRILKDKQNLRAIIAAAQQIATNGYQAGNVEQYATASRESLLDAIQGAG